LKEDEMTFCTDVDLLHWEPNLFRDAVFASQQLIGGTGDLNGTVFTLAGGSLTAAHVAVNQVIVLEGTIAGSYPITGVSNATQLVLSVLYDGLFPESGSAEPSPVGTATAVPFGIRTFWAQRQVVSDLLKRAAGIDVGSASAQGAQIINTEAMRRPCVLGTLQMIYSALAAAAATPTNFQVRADLYERMYRRALGQLRAEVDLNGDGVADTVRRLNVLELTRA
jgi:hypothetical protein